jgi:hypothetical protein
MGLRHRAKEAYLDSRVAEIEQEQTKIRSLFEKYEKEAANKRAKYVRLARRITRGIDEDGTVHISFRDRRPHDSTPIIELWDEDENRIILLCTLVKTSKLKMTKMYSLMECNQCSYQHRYTGREINCLRDIYLAMNDIQPECKFLNKF